METTAFVLAIVSALLCLVFSIAAWHKRRGRLYELASKFEGPPTLPVIGNALLFTGGNEAILKSISGLGKSYPTPFRFWFGHRLFIVAGDAEHLKVILTNPKTLEKSYVYTFLKPIFGEGIGTVSSSVWRIHRKLIQPTFNPKLVNSFSDVFSARSKILVDEFEQNSEGPEFEVFDLVALATMDMLCETVMGLKIGAQTNGATDYVHAYQVGAAHMCTRLHNIWLYPDFIFNRSKIGQEFWRSVKIVRDFATTVIEKRKRQLRKRCSGQSDTANAEDEEYNRIPRREALLDTLLDQLTHENKQWSDEGLRDEVTTMISAGYDTTAITISHVMLMLASHPEVQEKVYQELYEIYGDADVDERPVLHEDLRHMEYLERVIRETMRLFPVLPVIARQVTDDLEIGDFIIPKGSEVVIPVLEIHRREVYWQDPLKFDPDRFLPEEIAKRHPYTYLAFSAGPRNCIGIKYAMMAMKILQATILRRYVLKKDNIIPVKDIQVKMVTTLKTVEPVTLRIEKRTRN